MRLASIENDHSLHPFISALEPWEPYSVKGGEILSHGAEQKCTIRAQLASINVTLRQVSDGAVGGSERGGGYASAGSSPERTAAPVLLCLRR